MKDRREAAEFEKRYGGALRQLGAQAGRGCPDSETMLRYFDAQLAGDEIEKLEAHLDVCPICMAVLYQIESPAAPTQTLRQLPGNWAVLAGEIDLKVADYLGSLKPATRPARHRAGSRLGFATELAAFFSRVLSLKFAYALLLCSFLVGGIYGAAYLRRPAYFKLALPRSEETFTPRSGPSTADPLRIGVGLVQQGKYSRAITVLRRVLQDRPEDYAPNFYLGLAYLFDAQVALPGLPYGFDAKKVRHAIAFLKTAQSHAGDNSFLREDCLWRLGKAYLMLGNVRQAQMEFQRLLALQQPGLTRKSQARRILRQISHPGEVKE